MAGRDSAGRKREVEIPLSVTYASHGPHSEAAWRFSRWQVPVYNARKRTTVIEAGRGAGKDIVCIRAALRDAVRLYGQRKAEQADPKRRSPVIRNPLVMVWLIAEQEKNLKQLRRDMEGELLALAEGYGVPKRAIYRYIARQDAFEIFGRNQIRVEVILCKHKDSLRGPGVDVFVWTEFAMLKRVEAWTEEMDGTRNRAGREGIAYLNSTPKGPTGFFVQEAEGALDPENHDAEYFHAIWSENEFLTEAQIRAILRERAKDPDVFAQERLAQRVVLGKGASRFYESAMVDGALHRGPWKRKGEVVIGVDIARLGDDFTWFVVVDFESGVVLEMTKRGKTTGPELVKMFETFDKRWKGPEFVMDATQHQAFVADFVPAHIRITQMKIYERGKERLVLNLKHLLEVNRVWLQDYSSDQFAGDEQKDLATEMVRQLKSFQKIAPAPGVSGPVKYQAPEGDNDDGVLALSLACEPIALTMGGVPDAAKAVEKFSEAIYG